MSCPVRKRSYIRQQTTTYDISFLVEEGTAGRTRGRPHRSGRATSTGVSLGRARLLNPLPLAVHAVVQNISDAGFAILVFILRNIVI